MEPEKPYLFIGSSRECADEGIVNEFLGALRDDANCIPWYSDPQFHEKGSATTFAALCEAARDYDFALFLCSPDDEVKSRDTTCHAPRDNVVFELGLFISAIGPDRVMAFIRECEPSIKVPSDLSGVTMPRFCYDESDLKKSRASIIAATRGLANNIRSSGFRKIDLLLVDKWGFNSSTREFEVDLSAARITRARSTIGRWGIAIAARIRDPFRNMEDDDRVVYTPVRSLPSAVDHDIPFRIHEDHFKQPINPEDEIEARVLLVPESLEFDPSKTLADALRARCRQVETMRYQTGSGPPEPKDD
jgi:hypothetical protein